MTQTPIHSISPLGTEFLDALNTYRDWLFSHSVQGSLATKIDWPPAPLHAEGRPEFATSLEYLMSLSHASHNGRPSEHYGINLNYTLLTQC
jgi:hypothetical protein